MSIILQSDSESEDLFYAGFFLPMRSPESRFIFLSATNGSATRRQIPKVSGVVTDTVKRQTI